MTIVKRTKSIIIFKILNIEACNTPRCFKIPALKLTGEAKINLRLCEITQTRIKRIT